MKKTKSYRVSLHGHGPDSDGVSSIAELVEAAGRSKIDYFGLADHETTAGIPTLYREVGTFNRTHDHQIQAVSGIEVHFTDGDVIFSKAGPIDPAFLGWCESVVAKRETMPTARAINQAVRRFGAIVTIPHVDAPFAGSITRTKLSHITQKLTPAVRSHIAVEVRNYATALFWILTIAREEWLEGLVADLGLARVGFSDFHDAWMVKKQVAMFPAAVATPQALKKAIRTRTIRAAYRPSLGLFEWVRLLATMVRALVAYKIKYAGWSLPAFRPQPAMQ